MKGGILYYDIWLNSSLVCFIKNRRIAYSSLWGNSLHLMPLGELPAPSVFLKDITDVWGGVYPLSQ